MATPVSDWATSLVIKPQGSSTTAPPGASVEVAVAAAAGVTVLAWVGSAVGFDAVAGVAGAWVGLGALEGGAAS